MLEGFFGANLSQFSGNQDDFLRMYQSSEFDLIWIDTHGEYDQFNPHRAGLVVAEGAVVQLGQLIGRAPTQVVGRRLLVLNACDSAASGPIGAPGGLGLASSLASAKQAVVAHFCPVDQRIALVSGTDRRHP